MDKVIIYPDEGNGVHVRSMVALVDKVHSIEERVAVNEGHEELSYKIDDSLICHLFANNQITKVLAGNLTTTRSTTATYVDRYGVLRSSAINTLRTNEKGALIEGASTNLMINSESLSSIGIMAGTSVTTNAGTLPEGRQFNEATFNTAYNARFWQSLALTAGEYTVSLWLWVPTGTGVARLAGYDDGTYIYGPNIPLTATPTRHEFTYTTTNVGLQVVSVFNGSDQTPRTIRWVGCQVEALPFASSYIPTAGSPVTRAADDVSIPWQNNKTFDEYTVSAEVELLSMADATESSLSSRKYIWELPYFTIDNGFIDTDGTRIASYIGANTSSAVLLNGLVGLKHKFALTRQLGSGTMYADGNTPITDTSVTEWTSLPTDSRTVIKLGGRVADRYLWGYLKNFRIFDRALTEQEVNLL